MSSTSANRISKVNSKGSSVSERAENVDEDTSTTADFIYGGPFIKVDKEAKFLNTVTPFNMQLQGTFKKSFAYYSLKERLPIILTKVIDYLSRESSKIKSLHKASDEDIRGLIQYITKLKNDLVTNKKYDQLTVDTPEAKRWNQWIYNAESPYYFTNIWVFSECYVYRRLREGCELSKGLSDFDPFDEQKDKSFTNSLEPMCLVADKLVNMLPASDKDKRKQDFITLLKLCLWSNKCDLSLSMGEEVTLNSEGGGASQTRFIMDPLEMIVNLKDKVLVDDSAKICDAVCTRAENLSKTIEASPEVQENRTEDQETDPPQIPCPAKMTSPQTVTFDIICDNSGYELFTDLCLAHFLVSQGIVKKVRFHVKRIPWFVSDVTPRDFRYVISSCANAKFNREIPPEPKPAAAEGEASADDEPPRVINAENLRQLGVAWEKFVEDGVFVVMCDDFWTSPHVYRDMRKYDPSLYRKLQFAVALLFKGDLNYRKLLCEKNCVPTVGFETALQGFMPAPIVALRTVKADLICGLPPGMWEKFNQIDEKWMETGNYGMNGCFICNKVSLRNAVSVFGEIPFKSGKSTIAVIGEVIDKNINKDAVHTELLCRKCQKYIVEYDSLQVRLKQIKTEVIESFKKSLQRYNLNYDTYDDEHPKINILSKKSEPKKLVLQASKLLPLPPDFVLSDGKWSMAKTGSAIPKIKNVMTLPSSSTLNLKVTVGSSVLTQSINTNTIANTKVTPNITVDPKLITTSKENPKSDQTYTTTSNNQEYVQNEESTLTTKSIDWKVSKNKSSSVLTFNVDSLPKDFLSSTILKVDAEFEKTNDEEEGNQELVNNDDQPMEIDEDCSGAVLSTKSRTKLKFEEDIKVDGTDKFETEFIDMKLLGGSEGQYVLGKLMLQDDESDNDGDVEERGAFIKVESGEMYRVQSVESKTDEEDSLKLEAQSAMILNEDGQFRCLMCERSEDKGEPIYVGDSDATMLHLKSYHSARLYICRVCGHIERRRSDYALHMEEHNPNNKPMQTALKARVHQCNICDKKYHSKALLTGHMNMHNGSRPYSCSICRKTFASKYTHQSHLKTHLVSHVYS
ncbi:jg26319 [Pararge aegeria aegeria]|uniref:Damage-control phosphatase ARMT1 n=1 Tax=Pararge aegeria aegeria TaxID=348720 RepID=A0A8S4R826_9NEOP|nr:jg26319 [Pararge aegeria aegeria]